MKTVSPRKILHVTAWLVLLPALVNAERFPVKTYTVADGLPRDLVSRIRRDSRGFLWFCTAEGISRFDGSGMINFTVGDGLPDREVADFLETTNGTIYIATRKGIARLDPYGRPGSTERPLFRVLKPDDPSAEEIKTLYEDRKGQIWVGTSNGLYKLAETDAGARFENVSLGKSLQVGGAIAEPGDDSLLVNSMVEDRHGTLWVGTFGGGLFRISADGNIRRFTAEDGLGDNRITDLLEDRLGRLWVSKRSDETGGVCLLNTAVVDDPTTECYMTQNGLGSNWVRDLFESSDGQIWLATVPGLCRWNGDIGSSVCKTYTAKNGLCDDIWALAEDKNGNLWSGSPCGAQRLSRYGFSTYSAEDGLDAVQINSIFEDAAGNVFVSTNNNGRAVSRFDDDTFSLRKPRLPANIDYHGWGWLQTVLVDHTGAWWIPTGRGLFRTRPQTSFEALSNAPLENVRIASSGREIFRLFEDSRGDIWVSTTGMANELWQWERARDLWHDRTSQVGFSPTRVGTAFSEDRYGNVWIGATSDHNDSALIRFREGKFDMLTQSDGAPSGWIRDLFVDGSGRLWIASTNDGAWRLDETNSEHWEFKKYTPDEGLTSISTACVTDDRFGRIYIGTWRGIDRLSPDTGHVENFTTVDGLNSTFVQNAFTDRKGDLWFGTESGLARYVPEPPRQREPPTILITDLRVGGEQQDISILGETEIAPIDLRPDQRQVTVSFIGLGASLGEKLKYEYRIGDVAWTETAERTLNFANLDSGDYRLEIRALAAGGVPSLQPAVFEFRVLAPVYLRWWFIMGVVAGLAAIVYFIYRSRLNRLLEIERTRTRIATDLHDDIGSDLSKISLLSDIVRMRMSDDLTERDRMLSTIARISRSSVDAMRDIVWSIDPKRDSLQEMARRMRQHAEETFLDRDVKVNFSAPADGASVKLSMDVRRELFLVFKEAVNNAARHSACTHIDIDFSVSGRYVVLTVADNGRGFDSINGNEGNGLRNMRGRAERIGGQFELRSSDGTSITVRVPT